MATENQIALMKKYLGLWLRLEPTAKDSLVDGLTGPQQQGLWSLMKLSTPLVELVKARAAEHAAQSVIDGDAKTEFES